MGSRDQGVALHAAEMKEIRGAWAITGAPRQAEGRSAW